MEIILVGVLIFIFVFGAARTQRHEIERPSYCHYCSVMGEDRMAVWHGGHWVHEDTGGTAITEFDREAGAMLNKPPHAHIALPSHHVGVIYPFNG